MTCYKSNQGHLEILLEEILECDTPVWDLYQEVLHEYWILDPKQKVYLIIYHIPNSYPKIEILLANFVKEKDKLAWIKNQVSFP